MKLKISNLQQAAIIPNIKLIRSLTGMGLKDSKDFVEALNFQQGIACCEIETPPNITIEQAKRIPYEGWSGFSFKIYPIIEEAKKGKNQHIAALANEQTAHNQTKQELAKAKADITQLTDSNARLNTYINVLQNHNKEIDDKLFELQNRKDGVTFETKPDAIKVEAKLTVTSIPMFHLAMTTLRNLNERNEKAI